MQRWARGTSIVAVLVMVLATVVLGAQVTEALAGGRALGHTKLSAADCPAGPAAGSNGLGRSAACRIGSPARTTPGASTSSDASQAESASAATVDSTSPSEVSRAAATASAPSFDVPAPAGDETQPPVDATRSSDSASTGGPTSSAPTTSTSTPRTATASASAATPTASASAGFTAAFGTRPDSSPITCDGKSGVTISGHTFRGIGNGQASIRITNCSNVTITQNDFIDDAEPIFVTNSRNVRITYNRYRNITGPYTRDGGHHGNFTQWDGAQGGEISYNEGIGGDTEDIISLFNSGGVSTSEPLLIEGNSFEGTNWSSASGSGIMVGDGSTGSHVIVRGNTLVNPGQVGIGVVGGSDIHVVGNRIYGQQRLNSNIGLSVWSPSVPCSSIEVAHNNVFWTKDSGMVSGAWDSGTCGQVIGWGTNVLEDRTLTAVGLAPKL